MKSIWFISKYFSAGKDGSVGTRSWLILKHLASKHNKITVITSDSNHLATSPALIKKTKIEKLSNIDIIWLRTIKYTVAKSKLRILSWLHFEWNLFFLNKSNLPRPDAIIISSLSLLTILNGIYLKYKFRCTLVFEIRDIWPLTLTEEGGYSSKNLLILLLKYIERVGYLKSDLIVGTMPNLSPHVKDVVGYEKKVAFVPMVVDNEMLSTEFKISNDYIKTYLPSKYFNIVYAGTVGITNALDVFFKSAEQLQSNTNIRFVIVGDGALKDFYVTLYGNLPNLTFAPKVSKCHVNSVLRNASIVYFSTFNSKVWSYGQSLNKVIDYMLSERPILSSYSGYPSMINEADCGFFVEAEDVQKLVNKINQLYLMPEKDLAKIGSRGRSWLIENRYFEKVADDYFDLIFKD